MNRLVRSGAGSGAAPANPSADPRSFADAARSYAGSPPPTHGSRFVQLAPSTYDAEAHTIDLVLSTGSDVRRWGYIERLLIDPQAIDLTRVASGAVKVLDSHNAWAIAAVLGTLLETRFADGALIGKMKFGETPVAVEAEGMVARGELTSVSIGYEVAVWRAVEVVVDPATGAETTIWRADEWTLLEVSFVSVPADAGAGVRSAVTHGSGNPSANTGGATQETDDMNTRTAPAGAPPADTSVTNSTTVENPPVRAAEPASAVAAAPAASVASRFSAVSALEFVEQARTFGVEEQARTLIGRNERGEIGVEAAREEILRAAAERQRANTSPVPAGSAARVADNAEATRALVVDALVSRALRRQPSEAAREFMGMRLLEIAIARTSGINPRERDPITILRAANTTSDFPLILEAAANKILLDRYAAAAPTYQAIARRRDLRDFKATKLLRIGDFPTLKAYSEDGEIKAGTVSEGRESVTLGSYGRILRLSRQAIVNDDLGAFDDVFGSIGATVARFENTTFYAVKALNSGLGPKLTDGYAVFNAANHDNYLATGTAISVDSLGVGRAAMRTQADLDGNNLNISPATLLVGPDKETIAQQIVTDITPAQSTYVNPFSGKLTVVCEGSISGNAWELYADPGQFPVWSYGYLADAPGPRVLTEEPFNVDGIAYRVTLDFYAGAVDYRGAYRNAGA